MTLSALLALRLALAQREPSAGASFNVLDFGATGTGIADDTDAIQRALIAAANSTMSVPVGWGVPMPEQKTGGYIVAQPTLLFPAGVYRLSRTLRLVAPPLGSCGAGCDCPFPPEVGVRPPDCCYRACLDSGWGVPALRGVGTALLRMENESLDIFYGETVRDWHVSGLSLLGGRHQLRIGNNNSQNGLILIEHCSFQGSAGAGIAMIPPSSYLSPGSEADPSAPPHFHGPYSTQLVVKDSKFLQCDQALINWGDVQ